MAKRLLESDYVGKKYSKLTIISFCEKGNPQKVLCKCECGNEKKIALNHVRTGQIQSCGCLHRDISRYFGEIGKKYNRYTIVEITRCEKGGKTMALCRCECGTEKELILADVKRSNVKSCGCLKIDSIHASTRNHGMSGGRLWAIWRGMRNRCRWEGNNAYHNYGGRGIAVCDEWNNSFQAFYDWSMVNGYSDELTIDRIDTNGNYEPSNCQWATWTEQARNKRTFNKFGKSGIREVNGYYHVSIKDHKKPIWIGSYKTLEEAIQARCDKELELWGKEYDY